jgi:hypothetical protein
MAAHGSANGATLEDEVVRLAAIEEIRTLKARYWRYVDTKQWDAFGTLFAAESSFLDHAAGFACDGPDEIRSRIEAVLQPALTVHQGHQSEIEILDETHARGIWMLEDYLSFPPGEVTPENPYAGSIVRGWGHYVEEYVKVDGAWRFHRIDLYRLRLEVQSPFATEYPPVAVAAVT